MDGFSDPFVGDPDLTLTEKQTLSQEDWLLQVLSEVPPVSDTTAYAQPFTGLDNLLPQSGLQPIPETSSLSAFSEPSSLQDVPPALSTRSATSKRASTSSSTSPRKSRRCSHHDPDEPVEVVPRRFFPPTGTRKQHRSGFRQVPGRDGIVKKGRPSKKEYKEGGVGIDMYVHKKILLPANKDEVPEMPKPKPKPRLKSKSKSKSSIAVDNSENGATSGSSVVYQTPTPIGLATLPQPAAPQFNNNFNLAQPLMTGSNQGITGTEYSSWNAPNFNWSLSQPPQAADPIIQSGVGYGQQSSYLSVPSNSSYASTYSSPGVDPLALGPIQPDLASYSLQNGQISHSNQGGTPVGNYSSFSMNSDSLSTGMNSVGTIDYGSLPLSTQVSSIGASGSSVGMSGQSTGIDFGSLPPLNQYGFSSTFDPNSSDINSVGTIDYGSLPLSTQASSLGASGPSVEMSGQSTGIDFGSLPPLNQYGSSSTFDSTYEGLFPQQQF